MAHGWSDYTPFDIPLGAAIGGTGRTALDANCLLVGNGVGPVLSVGPGTLVQVLLMPNSIVFGGTAPKQLSGGPEMISYQYAAGVRVWEAMFVGSDFNARMLVDDVAGAGFELGPGGSGAFSDQDTSIRRWDGDGTLKLITNREVEVSRSDAPGGIRLSISVNPWSDGTLTSDGTQPSDGDTVTIGTTVYTFKNILGAAYDVKIGATIYATLTNLKAAINADGTAGVNYGAGTAANPVALVAYSWRNDTTLLYFHVHGSVCGTNVATASSTAHLVWSSNPLTRLVCMARVNGFAEYGYGALDVHHIGVDIPAVRISQAGVAGALISGLVDGDAQPRFGLQADGTMTWGPGTGAGDITFVRTAAAAVKFQGLGGHDAVTGFQILRANANPVLNVDTLNTRVGIGTAAPATALDVAGVVNVTGSLPLRLGMAPTDTITYDGDTLSNYGLSWFNDSTMTPVAGTTLAISDYRGIRFFTSANPRVVIDGDGKVGIGTVAPKSNFHVVGLAVYATNAAAVAAGLTAGAFYRTGADPDPVSVVH